MKATITKPDGTRIEVEASPEEIAKLAGGTTNAPQFIPAPFYPWWPLNPYVAQPVNPQVPYTPWVTFNVEAGAGWAVNGNVCGGGIQGIAQQIAPAITVAMATA